MKMLIHYKDVGNIIIYGLFFSSEKVKSKFDDQSEEEVSEAESVHQSENGHEDYIEDTPPESPIELKPELPPYFPAIQGCRNVEEFHCLNRIEEGTFGVVYRARDKKTGY